jgi:hypothetical protein
MMHEKAKVTESGTERAEWKRPEVREMTAGQAEATPSASSDAGVLS